MKRSFSLVAIALLAVSCGSKNEGAQDLAVASKIIIGQDDRQVIAQRNDLDRRMGLLLADNSDDKMALCSGTLIGERHVLTAAHCVYDQGVVKKNLAFMPGALPNYDWPHRYRASKVYIHKDYLPFQTLTPGMISMDQASVDLAVIELEDIGAANAGKLYGHYSYWGKLMLENSAIVSTIGYPGDKPLGTPIKASGCLIHKNNSNLFESDCDIIGGQSGSAVLINDPNYQRPILRGVVSSAGNRANYIVMLTGMHQAALTAIRQGGGQTVFTGFQAPRSGVVDTVLVLHNKCHKNLFFAIYAQFKSGQAEVKGFYEVKSGTRMSLGSIYGPDFAYYARDRDNSIRYAGEWFREDAIEGMNREGYRYLELDSKAGIKELSLTCS